MLTLPWTEVLTTNWDTLLEKSAQEILYPAYDVINFEKELATSQSPRIVKLHGSIGTNEDFTFSQEDFRKYPENYAVFVNFARHVLIENDLCLLGFSGDDPNFIHWAGWVRDRLNNKARKIYLVTLNLSAAKRKYLESINIIPIDLGAIVEDYTDSGLKHKKALELFLEAINVEKPVQDKDWTPCDFHEHRIKFDPTHENWNRLFNDGEYAVSVIKPFIVDLQRNRESYPNWLIIPKSLGNELESNLPPLSSRTIDSFDQPSKASILYEFAWRYKILYKQLPKWLLEELSKLMLHSNIDETLAKGKQVEIYLLLLRDARLSQDLGSFERWRNLAEQNSHQFETTLAEIAYEEALWARDRFDYQKLEELEESINGSDAIWPLRRASLLSEIGKEEDAKKIISDTYKKLRKAVKRQPNSVYLVSRLAWVHLMLRGLDWEMAKDWSHQYEEFKADPWDLIDDIKREILQKRLKYASTQDVEPLFDAGSYRTVSASLLKPSALKEAIELTRFLAITDYLGIPAQKVFTSTVNDLLNAGHFKRDWFYCILAIKVANSEDSDTIKSAFSRLGSTTQSVEETSELVMALMNGVKYWQKSSINDVTFKVTKQRVLLEVIARLSVKLSSEDAQKCFMFGVEFAKSGDCEHWWLYKSLKHTLKYSWSAINEQGKSNLLGMCLEFPLAKELGIKNQYWEWPNPEPDGIFSRNDTPAIRNRLNVLIEAVGDGSREALLRLIPLAQNKLLHAEELALLGEKIWKSTNEDKLPLFKDIYPFAWLLLPSNNPTKTRQNISDLLFNSEGILPLEMQLISISSATTLESPLFPNSTQAINLFKKLLSWKPEVEDQDDPFHSTASRNSNLLRNIGEVLARSIAPSLKNKHLKNVKNFDAILSLAKEHETTHALAALPYFLLPEKEKRANEIETIIRQNFFSSDYLSVTASVFAIFNWMKLSHQNKIRYPEHLTSMLLFSIEAGRTIGLTSVLYYIRKFISNKWLNQNEIEHLSNLLPILFSNMHYEKAYVDRSIEVSVPIIRVEIVKTVKKLNTINPSDALSNLIEEAKKDLLPEVRSAASM